MPPEQPMDDPDIPLRSEMLTDGETDDEDASLSPTSNTKTERKRRVTHSEIERRRREKMNRYIDEIAQLLPIDAAKKLDKLTVLRVAVETIKHLKGTTSKVSSTGFGKQIYLSDQELLQLVLTTIDQIGTYFFLIVECQKGRICYASSSTETILGYKPTQLCFQSIFDLACPSDVECIKQQLINEKRTSLTSNDELSNDSKSVRLIPTKPNSLEIGCRRTFSCRINSKSKRSSKKTASSTPSNYITVDFVGYIKHYTSPNDNETDPKSRSDRMSTTSSILTPSDVYNAMGTSAVSCLIAMGHVPPHLEKASTNSLETIHTLERMFSCKLNPDGQFTYLDQICYSLLGYPSQELLGMAFNEFIHDDDRHKLTDVWNRVCRDRQIVTSGHYRFRTKNGLYIILQTVFEPFVNPWNDELEIIVMRNKTKNKPIRVHNPTSTINENPRSVDAESPSALDSTELIRQLLPQIEKK